MENVKPFFDYNVSEKCLENNNYENIIQQLYNLGYRTIAINQIISTDQEGKKKNKKGETQHVVPPPFDIKPVKGCENMKILNRLTIEFSTAEAAFKVARSPNIKLFDIIAVMPNSAAAFMFCSNFEADILCFNSENKNEMKKNRKLYNQLIDKGYHFEICYAEAIEDSTKRRNIIQMAHVYHSLFKSKNIIISSGATRSILIRGPYDVINLGFIFGLSEQQCKSAISFCGKNVYINAVGRRHGKSVMFVENMEETVISIEDDPSVINLEESDDDSDIMEINEPPTKKHKTTEAL